MMWYMIGFLELLTPESGFHQVQVEITKMVLPMKYIGLFVLIYSAFMTVVSLAGMIKTGQPASIILKLNFSFIALLIISIFYSWYIIFDVFLFF
jgi:hypothetical protein